MTAPTISASPSHARALRSWVIACLNLDDDGQAIDPEPFPAESVIWSRRDHPRLATFCRISELSYVAQGPTETLQRRVLGVAEQRLRELAEWTVTIMVVTPATTDLAETAGVALRRVWGRYLSDTTIAMSEAGCAPLRRSPIRDLGRLAREARHESRAAFDLVLSVGSYIVERPGEIETFDASGTLEADPADLTLDVDTSA